MGWMKQIYVMCQKGTTEAEFTKPYHQALADEKDTMMFHGREITIMQAKGIEELVKDATKVFKK